MQRPLRILFCLAAWLMLSPLAFAMPTCVEPVVAKKVMACCEADEVCTMPPAAPERCVKCAPVLPPAAYEVLAPDVAPPLLLTFEQPIAFEPSPAVVSAIIPVLFHPPPPTLLALGMMLTC